MGTMANVKNQVESAAPQRDLRSLIESSAKELGRALPNDMKPQRLVRIALTCIRTTPDLAKCTPESFLGSLFTAAQLGLEPVAGRAYLLPFRNNRKKADGQWHSVLECQFLVGYKGLAELFYRHEKAVQLDWGVVHEHDEFEWEKGTDSRLKHRPASKDRGEATAYWVMATLQNGGKPFHVMSKAECMDHAKQHSKTYDKKNNKFYDSSPWAKNPDAMCLKTCLIQLAKLLPLSVELQRAIEADESSRDFKRGFENALDVPSTTNWDHEAVDVEPVETPEAANS